jgi:hypothetical protein
MDDERDNIYSTPEGDDYTLPAAQVPPADISVISAPPQIPTGVRENIASEIHDRERDRNWIKPQEPLKVSVMKDDQPSKFERQSIRIGWAGFGLGILSLFAACAAGYFVYGQFDQMKRQTKILSDTLEKAKADSIESGNVTKTQLGILQAQLGAMQKQTEVSERPWVSASVKMTEPLKFTDSGAHTSVIFSLKNVGHTPALETQYRANIVTLPGKTWMAVEIREAETRECRPMLQSFKGSPHDSPTLFPVDEFSGYWSADISHAGILEGLKLKETGLFTHKGYVSLYLVACVDYQVSFRSDHHQTGYGFQLGIPEQDGTWMGDIKPEGSRPEIKLILLDTFAN